MELPKELKGELLTNDFALVNVDELVWPPLPAQEVTHRELDQIRSHGLGLLKMGPWELWGAFSRCLPAASDALRSRATAQLTLGSVVARGTWSHLDSS